MRGLIVFCFMLVCLPASLMAQGKPKINFEEFRSWMKQSVVNGYSFVDAEQENGSFLASFMQLNKMVGVKILSSADFEQYKAVKGFDGSQPYDFKGTKAVFVNSTSSTFMYILSSKLNATFVISTSYCKFDKSTMEKIAVELGIGAKF